MSDNHTDIAAAIKARGIKAGWTARDLALHAQAVLQGAFILAKARWTRARRRVEAIFHKLPLGESDRQIKLIGGARLLLAAITSLPGIMPEPAFLASMSKSSLEWVSTGA